MNGRPRNSPRHPRRPLTIMTTGGFLKDRSGPRSRPEMDGVRVHALAEMRLGFAPVNCRKLVRQRLVMEFVVAGEFRSFRGSLVDGHGRRFRQSWSEHQSIGSRESTSISSAAPRPRMPICITSLAVDLR